PLYNTFWLRDNKKFEKLFPMTLRPQAHDIIRTWTFYTMLRSRILTDKKPWHDIMIHGYIMAPDGKPMHTSLGNIIDPIPILEEHGSDAFRYYTTTCMLGKDSSFMHKEVIHGTKLCTKLWNIQKYIKNAVGGKVEKPGNLRPVDSWILSKYGKVVEEATEHLDKYEFNFAVREVEQFMWHQFADHYMEMVKHRIKEEGARYTLYTIGYGIARLLAPFVSHITEEVYQDFYKEFEGEKSIHIAPWPSDVLRDEEAEEKGEAVKDAIAAVRTWKASKGLKLSSEISFVEIVGDIDKLAGSEADILGTTKAKELKLVEEEDIKEEVEEIRPNYALIGTEFRDKAKEILETLKNIPEAEMTGFAVELEKGGVKLELKNGETVNLTKDMVDVKVGYAHEDKELEIIKAKDLVILVKE
ncbi:MAG: class I tRNA ligase family protein, partial [Thermoplasmata archaeon]|nr:class I tRNA ligase family protein [Thermoplasmata archaeon]